MKKQCAFFLLSFLLTMAFIGHNTEAYISNGDLAEKTKNMVYEAHAFVEKHSANMALVQKALETDPRFRDDELELYVFMHSYNPGAKEAICIGQGVRPELVGKNMWDLRTPNGRLLFNEFMDGVESHGEMWFEYDWLNPYTKKIGVKQSFLKKIILQDGRKAWIGIGFWKK